MNITLGFGATEAQYRENTKRKIKEIVKECVSGKFVKWDDVCFDDEILKEIKEKVEEYAKETRRIEEEISVKPIAERPERYSYVYIYFMGNLHNLFFGIDFSHLNSRHTMSPDGMAMITVKECQWIQIWEIRDLLKCKHKII